MALLTACSCTSPTPTPAPSPTAAQVLEAVETAWESIETYKFTLQATSSRPGSPAETTAVSATGEMDRPNGKAHTMVKLEMPHMQASHAMSGLLSDLEYYHADGWDYFRSRDSQPLSGLSVPGWGFWQKSMAEKPQWDVAHQILEPLRSAEVVELLGVEAVDGTNCYKLGTTVNGASPFVLPWWTDGAGGQRGQLAAPADAQLFVYVAVGTFLPCKAGGHASMTASRGTVEVDWVLRAYDLNQPASIVLPPDTSSAEEAVPGSQLPFPLW